MKARPYKLTPEEINQPEIVLKKIINDLSSLLKTQNQEQKTSEHTAQSLARIFINLYINSPLDLSSKNSIPKEIKNYLDVLNNPTFYPQLEKDSEIAELLSRFFSYYPEYWKELNAKVRDKLSLDFSWMQEYLAYVDKQSKLLDTHSEHKISDEKEIILVDPLEREKMIQSLEVSMKECKYNLKYTMIDIWEREFNACAFSSEQINRITNIILDGKDSYFYIKAYILKCNKTDQAAIKTITDNLFKDENDFSICNSKLELFQAAVPHLSSLQSKEVLRRIFLRSSEEVWPEETRMLYRCKIYSLMLPTMEFAQLKEILEPLLPCVWKQKHSGIVDFVIQAFSRDSNNKYEKKWQENTRNELIRKSFDIFNVDWATKQLCFHENEQIEVEKNILILNKILLSLPSDDKIKYFRKLLKFFETLQKFNEDPYTHLRAKWKHYGDKFTSRPFSIDPLFKGLSFCEEEFGNYYSHQEYISEFNCLMFSQPLKNLVADYLISDRKFIS